MKSKLKMLMLIFATLSVLSVSAGAYELLPHKVTVDEVLYAQDSFGSTSVNHMRYAINKWNDAADFDLVSMSSLRHHYSSGFPSQDGENYVYAIDVGNNYVALCSTRYVLGELTEADININMYYSWANSAVSGCYDVYTVFLHEMGHMFGLDDLYDDADADAVMYGYVDTNSLKRTLTQDDLDGISEKYG